ARLEPLGEPPVDVAEQCACLGPPSLLPEEPRDARREAQLKGLPLLGAREVESTTQRRLRGGSIPLPPEELAAETPQLGLVEASVDGLAQGEPLVDDREPLGALPALQVGCREVGEIVAVARAHPDHAQALHSLPDLLDRPPGAALPNQRAAAR